MSVEMIQVSSSNIYAVGYDAVNLNVYVQFLNNTEYIYKGVQQHDFDGLLNAPSVGSYLNQNYKNVYPYEKIA